MNKDHPTPLAGARIKPIRAADISDLIELGQSGNLSPWSASNYLEELDNPQAILLKLVSAENSIVGFVVGRLVAGGVIEMLTDAEIYNITVDAAFRRLGLGQALFDEFVSTCRTKDVSSVWLEVRESNTAARAFYAKNRFEHVHTRKHFYRDPIENALLMRLTLK